MGIGKTAPSPNLFNINYFPNLNILASKTIIPLILGNNFSIRVFPMQDMEAKTNKKSSSPVFLTTA